MWWGVMECGGERARGPMAAKSTMITITSTITINYMFIGQLQEICIVANILI